MRKIIACLPLFFSTFSLHGQQTATSQPEVKAQQKKAAFNTYTDPKEKVSVKYPGTWIQDHNTQTVFMFMRPVEEKGQKFKENINLVIGDAQDLALVEYLVDARTKMKQQMQGFREMKSQFIKINGIDFVRMVYRFTNSGLPIKSVLYLAVYNGKAYSLTCTAIDNTFDRFYPLFQKMAESFKIK